VLADKDLKSLHLNKEDTMHCVSKTLGTLIMPNNSSKSSHYEYYAVILAFYFII